MLRKEGVQKRERAQSNITIKKEHIKVEAMNACEVKFGRRNNENQ